MSACIHCFALCVVKCLGDVNKVISMRRVLNGGTRQERTKWRERQKEKERTEEEGTAADRGGSVGGWKKCAGTKGRINDVHRDSLQSRHPLIKRFHSNLLLKAQNPQRHTRININYATRGRLKLRDNDDSGVWRVLKQEIIRHSLSLNVSLNLTLNASAAYLWRYFPRPYSATVLFIRFGGNTIRRPSFE